MFSLYKSVHITQTTQALREILIVILPLAYISVNTNSLSGIVTFVLILNIAKNSTKFYFETTKLDETVFKELFGFG